MRLLAVSDEVDPRLETPLARRLRPDVLLGAGDLEASYLDYLTNLFEVPLVYVPGNHDPDLSGVEMSAAGLLLRAGLPTREIGPAGGINADEAVVDIAGLRIGGLGGGWSTAGGCRARGSGGRSETAPGPISTASGSRPAADAGWSGGRPGRV